MIDIKFESWELLIKQIICIIPILVAIIVFVRIFVLEQLPDDTRSFEIKQPTSTEVQFTFRDASLSRLPSGPKKKSISLDVDQALTSRTIQHVKCPYCKQNNLTDALSCTSCGGQL